MVNNEQFLTMNSSKIVSTKKDVIIGEDNTDILNINSKLSFSGRDNIILPTPVSSESNKLLKIDNSGNNLELDNNGIGNNSRAYIVCSELSSNNWGDITPVDGELTVFPGQEIMFYINSSGSRNPNGLSTWTFKYKIDSDSSFTTFNYPTNSQFKHWFNASNDNQHRSATFYYKNNKSINVVFKKFELTFNGVLDNSEDFVTITGVVLNSKDYPLAGAGGTAGGTPSVTNSISPSTRGADKIFDGKIGGGDNDQWVTNNTVDLTTVEIAYEFNTPQIVTKYRLWPRNSSTATSQSPSAWELRAAIDSSEYSTSKYTLLDVQSGLTSSDWNNTISNSGLINAVDNLAKANEYNLSTIGAYKYYVIKFTAGTVTNPSDTTNHLALSEVALYSDISLHKQVSSFKPDIPLAGGGGNLFQNVTSSALHNASAYPLRPLIYNNILNIDATGVNSAWTSLAFWDHPNTPVANPFLAYEFRDPQIVTSYRIWPMGNIIGQAPKGWELRASADSATYNSGSGTYTVLDTQLNQSFKTWSTTGDLMASLNFDKGNLYNIETSNYYKFYVLHFISGYHSAVITLSEWALYGDGLILPDQTNNANKKLITNGINLEWSNDVEPILTGSGSSHDIIKVNPNSNGLEYGGTDAVKIPCANNSFRPHQSKNGMMRYNNESNYYEVYDNGWHKIITKDMYETSIGLLNRDFIENKFNDKINNSYGYYVHGRNNPPLYSGSKLGYNIYHSLTFDTVLYDNSPLQNMADISNNRINIKKTGDYLINYKSSFGLTNHIDMSNLEVVAGAGISTGFDSYGLYGNNATSVIATSTYNQLGYYENSSSTNTKLYDNILLNTENCSIKNEQNPVGLAYEFNEIKFIKNYKIWITDVTTSPTGWELRASKVDKSTYDSNDESTYDVLDTRINTILTFNSFINSDTASNSLNYSNSFDIPIDDTGHKYYILHMTAFNNNNYVKLNEFALYCNKKYIKVSTPLAGANGTESFTAHATPSGLSNQNVSYIYDNTLQTRYIFNSPRTNVFVGYEFTTPQVVNKYRIWGYPDSGCTCKPTGWELRASVNKAAYDVGGTGAYQVLDTKSGINTATFPSATIVASNNLNTSYEVSFTNTTSYGYYVLFITANDGDSVNTTLYQFSLYGDKTNKICIAGAECFQTASNYLVYASPTTNGGSGSIFSACNNLLTDKYIFSGPNTNVFFAYELRQGPEIVTQYRIWGNIGGSISTWPTSWELRASKVDKSTYDSNDESTYDVLDSVTITSVPEPYFSSGYASDQLKSAYTGTINNSTAYRYYVLYITANGGDTVNTTLYQFAIYKDDTYEIVAGYESTGTNISTYISTSPLTSDYVAANAFDNQSSYSTNLSDPNYIYRGEAYYSTSGIFSSGTATSHNYIGCELNNPEVITKYSIFPWAYNNGDRGGAIRSWDFVACNSVSDLQNNTNLTVLDSKLLSTGTTNNDVPNAYDNIYILENSDSPANTLSHLANNYEITNDTAYSVYGLVVHGNFGVTVFNIVQLGLYKTVETPTENEYNNLADATQQLSTNFKIKINRNDNLLYESNLIKASSGLINNKTHYFIDDFNYITSLAEGDYINILLQHQTSSNNLMLSYDYVGGYSDTTGYNIDENYNYEYMKYIASQLIVKKLLIV